MRRLKGNMAVATAIIVLVPVFASIIGLAMLTGSVGETLSVTKKKTIGIHADRVVNTALALQSMPEGYIELDMKDYWFRLENQKLWLKYGDKEVERRLQKASYDSYNGPDEYTAINSSLCLRKKIDNDLEKMYLSDGCD